MRDVVDNKRHKHRARERALAVLANRQHGTVAWRQLIALGFTSREIYWRIQAGRLHVVHRGVYAVGHRTLTQRGRWMAAVLACGPDTVLSHRDAAALHDLRRARTSGPIHVTVPGGSRKARPGIQIHSSRHLHPEDCTEVDGIPVTTVERALLDHAESASAQEFLWAFEAYDRQDRLDTHKLDAVMERNAGRRGTKALRAFMIKYRGAPDTRSKNERRFLSLLRAANVPEPSMNVVVAGEVVDFYWPSHRLVVEVDGYHFHHTPADRAADRRKQRKLRAAHCTVHRVTDEELGEPAVADVVAILSDVEAGAGR